VGAYIIEDKLEIQPSEELKIPHFSSNQ